MEGRGCRLEPVDRFPKRLYSPPDEWEANPYWLYEADELIDIMNHLRGREDADSRKRLDKVEIFVLVRQVNEYEAVYANSAGEEVTVRSCIARLYAVK